MQVKPLREYDPRHKVILFLREAAAAIKIGHVIIYRRYIIHSRGIGPSGLIMAGLCLLVIAGRVAVGLRIAKAIAMRIAVAGDAVYKFLAGNGWVGGCRNSGRNRADLIKSMRQAKEMTHFVNGCAYAGSFFEHDHILASGPVGVA